MMDGLHRQSMGSSAGVCNRASQSRPCASNEYLARIGSFAGILSGRLRLSDPERATLAEIGKRLGRKALEQVACVAKPDTILPGIDGWSLTSSTVRSNVRTLAARG
jgi:hypothetical protein